MGVYSICVFMGEAGRMEEEILEQEYVFFCSLQTTTSTIS